LKKYIVGPDKSNSKYDLYGVIQHFGSINDGHYTAMCKNQDNWIDYNDSRIDFVKDNNPISQNAYILFYKSKDLDNISDTEDGTNEINEKEDLKIREKI
jgi:ubiquitin C-terminal hydrolase